MDPVLRFILAGTRTAPARMRIVRALCDGPRTVDRLAAELDLTSDAVRHQLDVLEENQLVRRCDRNGGGVYALTDDTKGHRATIRATARER